MAFSGWCLLVLTFLLQALPGLALPWPHRTRQFDFSITWDKHAPDGFDRSSLLVNGQSPGPLIEVDQDDWVVVCVHNFSPKNVTIHYHGIEMMGTPWSDGVPGLSQRPILPGDSFTYQFQATQYGSYWYHSHFQGQIEDGLYGPIIIHPRSGDPKPFHMIDDDAKAIQAMTLAEQKVRPLAISDWVHLTSDEKWDMSVASGIEDACYDSILFNGKGRVYCIPEDELEAHLGEQRKSYLALAKGAKVTDKGCLLRHRRQRRRQQECHQARHLLRLQAVLHPLEVFQADGPSQWVAIDIIGAINLIAAVVAIDEHDMWVYAMDGSYITPQKVQAINLFNGDRYSVLVKTHKAGDFQIRVGAVSAPQVIAGHAIFRVNGPGGVPGGNNSTPFIDIAGNPSSKDADALFKLHIQLAGATYLWALNSTRVDLVALEEQPVPILFQYPDAHKYNNVTISTLNGTWVDLVLLASLPPIPHPIHKHNNKMYQIGAGTGDFTWDTVEDAVKEKPELFNLVDPPRRDAFTSVPAPEFGVPTWIVVRYHVVNPGAWLMHCHINSHVMGGMSVVIQDGVDRWPTVPPEYRLT
ncbi:Multicopper oxidase MCE [Cladobotryum mycophilum]|uniref:Multicopper oxidase MCE n=1 Tax=Cladobotryum mycophilum TaxID=491253 RepID=A0ABR0SJ50_9HYPO